MQRATSIWRRFLRLLPLVVYLLLSQAQGVPLHPGSSPETMLQPDSLRFSSDSSRAEQFYPDNSPVDIKVPSRKVVDSLKKDRDFSYLRTVARDDSWWIRFWEWLGSLFTRAASDSSGFDLWGILFTRILPWTVALAAIVLVVMKLMGVDIDSLIRKKAVSPTVIFEETAGDIDPGDFE